MKNLKQLCLFLSVGGAVALSTGACSDDPATTNTTAGTASGGTAPTAGTPAGGTAPTAGTPATGGTATAGTASGGTGTAGTATAGTGGASGGSGSGGKAGGGGMGGASGGMGGASGGSAGSGGSGGGASAGCMKICMGADSIGTICAGEAMSDTIKNMCLASCAKATAQQVTCWNEHVANAKNMPAMKATHCGHAAGMAPCSAWPTP